MKSLLIVFAALFLFAVPFKSFTQARKGHALYEKKIRQYKRVKTLGIILGGSGVLLTAAGVGLLNNEAQKSYQNKSYVGELGGGACLVVGIPLTATGIVLGTIGAVKQGKYKNKLEKVSFNLNYNRFQKGLVLRYSF